MKVPLTTLRFDKFVKPAGLAQPTLKTLQDVTQIVGKHNLLTSIPNDATAARRGSWEQHQQDELYKYNTDWWNQYRGSSKLVVFPTTTAQVSDLLKYCNFNKLPVVTQAGNTSVVGGSVPIWDEIILNTSRLNKITDVNATSGIVTCQAGVVLQQLDNEVEQRGLIVPLDLGAKGSCQIGGNVATNAGGLRFVKYGSLRNSVLSLEVVLADGTVLNCGAPLRKDNTGYALKQLFIGSEGTLGVITAVSLQCPPRPTSRNVAIAVVPSYEAVQQAFVEAKSHLQEILTAIEFWDFQSTELVKRVLNQSIPEVTDAPFYVLIETSGSNQDHDMEKLDVFLSKLLEKSIALDGVVARDEKQANAMWSFRENIPVAWGKDGLHCLCYDLDLPLPHLYNVVTELRQKFHDANEPLNHLVGFGHVGDFNLHLNLAMPAFSQRGLDLVEPFIYDYTRKYRGSISAEHGVGIMKKPYLHYSKTAEEIALMKKFKHLLDPNGILNPGKMF